MKLNPDCVRDVLLALETLLVIDESGSLIRDITIDEIAECTILKPYTEADIIYTIQKLTEADFINPLTKIYADGEFMFSFFGTRGITYQGHEFLDTIRAQPIWQKTKTTILEKLGSASLSVFSSVAAEFAKRSLFE